MKKSINELELTIWEIVRDYLEKYNLTRENAVNYLELIYEHVKSILDRHYHYKKEIPNLKILIKTILLDKSYE